MEWDITGKMLTKKKKNGEGSNKIWSKTQIRAWEILTKCTRSEQ